MAYNLIESLRRCRVLCSARPVSLNNRDQLPSFYSEGIFVPLRSSEDHNTFKYYGPEILGALPSTETNIANHHSPHPYIGNQLRGGFAAGQLNTYFDHRDNPEIGATGGFELDSIPAGRVEPQLNTYFPEVLSVLLADAEFSSRRCWVFSPARHGFWHRGRVEPQLNGLFSQEATIPVGGVELESNWSRTAVTLRLG